MMKVEVYKKCEEGYAIQEIYVGCVGYINSINKFLNLSFDRIHFQIIHFTETEIDFTNNHYKIYID